MEYVRTAIREAYVTLDTLERPVAAKPPFWRPFERYVILGKP